MKKYIFYYFLLIGFCIFINSGCTNFPNDLEEKNISEKPIIAVSILPQEEFVKEIAGNDVEILVLIPPGKSPANYAPTIGEMQKLSNAVIYFSMGVPTEEINILPRIKEFNPDLKIINTEIRVAEVYKDRLFAPEKRDPHIWLSPQRVKIMVDQICEELTELKPDKKNFYQKNKKEYQKKLDDLDKTIKEMVRKVSKKIFIMYHPSLGYFADDYSLTMHTVEKDGKEVTIHGITNIIETAKENGIKVIFCQTEHDSASVKILANEIGGRIEIVSPLSRDYINSLLNIAQKIANSLK